ncbi:MAG: carboxypeptidase regulatory-like domain-containing protein [Dehalococcoidales bacterium]|nr:carboxypeptidase regulatory-like domain-containing protein [Dehalococcoidales bacterium]
MGDKKVAIGIGAILTAIGIAVVASRRVEAAPPPGETADLYGQVTDEQHQPLSSVVITLNGYQSSTDSNGLFIFSNIPPGTYPITFTKPGYETLTL